MSVAITEIDAAIAAQHRKFEHTHMTKARWALIVAEYAGDVAANAFYEDRRGSLQEIRHRERLLNIAAVALAAIQWLDEQP